MSKGKKIYCIASFAFACAVLILTITLCMMHPGRVYASSMNYGQYYKDYTERYTGSRS